VLVLDGLLEDGAELGLEQEGQIEVVKGGELL